jgi:modulator of FtsH protease
VCNFFQRLGQGISRVGQVTVELAFAFTGFLGYILGPMLNAYLSAGMGDLIGLALGGTALVFFCCSAYVLTTRKDMSFLGGM